ncbi:protein kinase [bacterium AH-315-F18]|nr:protein kinase [bacterium AH-315-F18]
MSEPGKDEEEKALPTAPLAPGTVEFNVDDIEMLDDVPPGKSMNLADTEVGGPQVSGIEIEADGHSPMSGMTLGKYRIEREIARGSVGVVFEAFHTELKKTFALKMLLGGDAAADEDIERFKREAEILSNLDHPNLIKVHDVGLFGDRHYLTMDYIRGCPLSDIIHEEGVTLEDGLRFLQAAAEGVQAAHDAGVIHRDIKPDNIMVDENGHVYVADFGLGRYHGIESKLTRPGAIMGTPHYMAPEQVLAEHNQIGPATDIYALGVIAYEMACGTVPFDAENLQELINIIALEDPRPPRSVNVEVSEDVERICLMAMEKSPSRRYTTAGALAADIGRVLSGEQVRARSQRRHRPFTEILEEGVTLDSGLKLIHGAALAIQIIHEARGPHRDIKPDILIVDKEGDVHVLDAGVGQHLKSSAVRTASGIIGKPHYLAPEQLSPRHGKSGLATDVYALGVIMYELICGRLPFDAPNAHDLMWQITGEDPPWPRKLDPTIPPEVERICMQTLERSPDRRYETARAFADDLNRFMAGKDVNARSLNARYRIHRWIRRKMNRIRSAGQLP